MMRSSFVWHNVSTGETSKEDPRAVQLCRLLSNGLLLISIDSDDPLPAGWTMSFDDEGVRKFEEGCSVTLFQDVFFIDHNSGITTYDDPRLICTEVVDLSAERIAEQLTEDRLKTEFARGQADSPAAWKVLTQLPYICDTMIVDCHCSAFRV